MRTVVLYARSPDWREVVERADELMASADFRVIKSEARTRAGFIDVPGAGPAFIKRVDISSWSRGVFQRIRGSRASSFARRRCDAESTRPRASGTARGDGFVSCGRDSRVVSRQPRADQCRLSEPLHARPRRNQGSQRASPQTNLGHGGGANPAPPRVAGFTRAICKRPTSWSKITTHGGFNVYFIDLEDFRRAANVSWKRRITNLVHLDRSIGRFLCRAARLDFLYSYLGHRPDRAAARKIVAEVKAAREAIDRRKRRGVPAAERVVAPLAGGTR